MLTHSIVSMGVFAQLVWRRTFTGAYRRHNSMMSTNLQAGQLAVLQQCSSYPGGLGCSSCEIQAQSYREQRLRSRHVISLLTTPVIHTTYGTTANTTTRGNNNTNFYTDRLSLLFSFPCSVDHQKREWLPCKKVVFRVYNQKYAECEKQPMNVSTFFPFVW